MSEHEPCTAATAQKPCQEHRDDEDSETPRLQRREGESLYTTLE